LITTAADSSAPGLAPAHDKYLIEVKHAAARDLMLDVIRSG